jgi:hypothetical protein
VTSYQWNPTPDGIDQANVTRLARAHGLAGIDELRARSVADTAWYWDAAATDLGLRFRAPYSRVLDLHNGIEHPDWFVDATLNIVDSCLLRWRDEAPDRVAVVHEDEAGRIRGSRSASWPSGPGAANGLRELGIGPGDAVLYLPMIRRRSSRVMQWRPSERSWCAVFWFRLDGDRLPPRRRRGQGGHRRRRHDPARARATASAASQRRADALPHGAPRGCCAQRR